MARNLSRYSCRDPKAVASAIESLRSHFRSNRAVALWLGLPPSTYRDWLKNGLPGIVHEEWLIQKANCQRRPTARQTR